MCSLQHFCTCLLVWLLFKDETTLTKKLCLLIGQCVCLSAGLCKKNCMNIGEFAMGKKTTHYTLGQVCSLPQHCDPGLFFFFTKGISHGTWWKRHKGTDIYECVQFSLAWLNLRGSLALGSGLCSTMCPLYSIQLHFICIATNHTNIISRHFT